MLTYRAIVSACRLHPTDWTNFKKYSLSKYEAMKNAVKEYGRDRVHFGLDKNAKPCCIIVL